MTQASFAFYSTEPRRSREFVRQSLKICESVDAFELGPPSETVELEDFTVDESAAFQMYWQDGPGRVSVGFIYEAMPENFLEISTRREIFVPDGDEGEYEGLTGGVIELVRALAIEHDPYYVMSLVVHSGSRDQLLTRSAQSEATESVV